MDYEQGRVIAEPSSVVSIIQKSPKGVNFYRIYKRKSRVQSGVKKKRGKHLVRTGNVENFKIHFNVFTPWFVHTLLGFIC